MIVFKMQFSVSKYVFGEWLFIKYEKISDLRGNFSFGRVCRKGSASKASEMDPLPIRRQKPCEREISAYRRLPPFSVFLLLVCRHGCRLRVHRLSRKLWFDCERSQVCFATGERRFYSSCLPRRRIPCEAEELGRLPLPSPSQSDQEADSFSRSNGPSGHRFPRRIGITSSFLSSLTRGFRAFRLCLLWIVYLNVARPACEEGANELVVWSVELSFSVNVTVSCFLSWSLWLKV